MARQVMILQSSAKPGRGEEYSEWCQTRHFPDIMRIPGVVAARRYALRAGGADEPARFMAVFDLDCEDPQDVVKEMQRRNGTAQMPSSDCFDPASLVFSFGTVEIDLP